MSAYSIRFYLILLVVLSQIPMLAGLYSAVRTERDFEREKQRSSLRFATQRLADTVDRELDGYVAALQALSVSPSLKAGRWSEVDLQARELAAMRGTAVSARRADGQQLLNTYVPWGTALPVSRDPVLRAADALALAEKRVVVSDLYIGATARTPYVQVLMPTQAGGEEVLLNIAVSPERLSDMLAKNLPSGWTAVLQDSRFKIIARSADQANYVGLSATSEQIAAQSAPDGVWEGHRIDGTPIIAAHVRLASGWTVSIGSPTAQLVMQSPPILGDLFSAVTAGALLSLLVSVLLARRLERDIAALPKPLERHGAFIVRELKDVADQLGQAQNTRDLLLRELDHRLKNVFATVLAMLTISSRTARDRDELTSSLRDRIHALSAVHDLVRGTGVEKSTTVDKLVDTVLRPHGGPGGHIEVRGDGVCISAQTAIVLGMVLNELLTNALKYGSLSTPEGRLALSWSVMGGGFEFIWHEARSSAAASPGERVGFGSMMIRQSMHALGGNAEFDWKQDGLVVHLHCPQRNLTRPA